MRSTPFAATCQAQRDDGQEWHWPHSALGHDASAKRVLHSVEQGLDGPVVDRFDGHPSEAPRERALELDRVSHAAAITVDREVEPVPARAAHDVHSPGQTVPDAEAKAERSMTHQSLAGDEAKRVGPGRIPSPAADDVAGE